MTYLRSKFEDSSFTHSNDMKEGSNIKLVVTYGG